MLMCFVLEWKTGLTANFCADWLSLKMVILDRCLKPNSSIQVVKYMPSFADSVRLMYSASVDDKATVFCFLEHQEIADPESVNTYPE